ncbi:coenzyme F420-0:L-glutamate ligase [Dactylosporangium cerinum]|uniref:Coenzyme F420-0:L-glutamate ligase n=1 Tax=Dactylosporangium cerinum TaxID=1434730 RepID=A0ABV9WGC2_9ACTN
MAGPELVGGGAAAAVGFEVRAVTGIGEVRPGDDLAALITTAAPWLADGDILVVTSKIVSKAEGQLVDVPLDEPARETAREAILRAETSRVVARRGGTQIVQTHHGFVLASAGIDASNVEPTRLVLLPKDPDASARWLRDELRERFDLRVAVVVTDTMGRPWRMGLTDVAIGAAGIDAVTDYRGVLDPYGNELQLTQMAVIDELAGAADLVKGKTGQVPVAVVRGLPIRPDGPGTGAAALIRGADADLFSLGTAEAVAKGLRAAADIRDTPPLVFPPVPSTALPADRSLSPAVPADRSPSSGTPATDSPGGVLPVAAAPAATAGPAAVAEPVAATEPAAVTGPVAATKPVAVTEPVAVAGLAAVAGSAVSVEESLLVWAPAGDLRRALEAGMEVQRIRARLAADGVPSGWLELDQVDLSGVDVPEGGVPLGVLTVGRGSLPSL